MGDYLVFQVMSSIASYGISNHKYYNKASDSPTESAITGLIATCLGIDSQEADRQAQLRDWLDIHICALPSKHIGQYMMDFQTDKTGKTPRIQWVEYSISSASVISISANTDVLETIEAALQSPKFIPCAGKLCCPFDMPFCPKIILANGHIEAIDLYLNLELERLAELGGGDVL